MEPSSERPRARGSAGEGSLAAIAVVLGVLFVVAAVFVASYLGGWWIFADSTKREGEIRRQTFEFQQGRVDSAGNQMADIRAIDTQLLNPELGPDERAALRAQRAGIVRQACKAIGELPGAVPDDLAAFKAKECA